MTIPEWLLAIAGIAIPVTVPAGVVIAKRAAKDVEVKMNAKMDIHVAEDKVIHENMSGSLERIEAKLDRLIEAKYNAK